MKRYILITILFTTMVLGASYPLEIVRPASDIGSNDRIYKAYPGIEYEIRAAVIGGTYPFEYSLQGEPEGMSISDDGIIRWPSPQDNTGAIILSVTDAEGTTVTANWSINVTTQGFYFVDATAADGGNGSLESPWNGWEDFYLGNDDDTYANAIVYFKNGTYTYPSEFITSTAGSSNRLPVDEDHPIAYLAYPGHDSVLFDGERLTEQIHLFASVDNQYFEGIDFVRGYGYGIEKQGGDHFVARDCSFYDHNDSGSASNQAGISIRADAPQNNGELPENDAGFKLYSVIQNCSFHDLASSGITTYGIRKTLIEDCDFSTGPGVALKSTTDRTTVRRNSFTDGSILGMAAQYYTFNSDISFNLLDNGNSNVMLVGSYDGTSGPGPTYIYRNTILGQLYFRYIEDDDGPIHIYNNVIVNDPDYTPQPPGDTDDHVRDEVGEHYSISVDKGNLTDNLMGFPEDNITDLEGNLLNESLIGTYGHGVSEQTIYFSFDGESGYRYTNTSHPGGGRFIHMGGDPDNPEGTGCSDVSSYHNTVLSNDASAQGSIPGSQWALKTPYSGDCPDESFTRDTTIIRLDEDKDEYFIRWSQKWTGNWNSADVQQKFSKFTEIGGSDEVSAGYFSFGGGSTNWRCRVPNLEGRFDMEGVRHNIAVWVYATQEGAGSQYEGVNRAWDDINNGIGEGGTDAELYFETERWYDLEIHAKMNSDASTADAELEAWVDGQQVFGVYDFKWYNESPGAYGIGNFELQHIYYNRDPTDQPTYMDNIVIADSYIGPADTGSHEADTDSDGMISNSEIRSYVGRWKTGTASIMGLIEALELWK